MAEFQANLSPDANQVLVLARAEAERIGNNYIGPEHLFLALLSMLEARAVKVLQKLGVEVETEADETPGQMIRYRSHTAVAEKSKYGSLSLGVILRKAKNNPMACICFAEKLERVNPGLDYQEARFHSRAQEQGHALFDALTCHGQ